ncbi:TetR/AcrR family transcriptional regulator [Poseidonocella sp. HB161398]|uniref:TetR/AcrR family transcriptional regulator n=1 Tax=Poseidonocella sp. HB161398 TaxID=2320855 RepID=UPI0011096548|nr:TetR/AcrR family transcriptional regulator [Poseidonocella sp. HB161398]
MDEGQRQKGWKQDPAGVRQNILAVATELFAQAGLSGTRIEEIAARTRTSKRMIYYYFGSKDGLYLRVLEAAYDKVRDAESELDLAGLPPEEALARLVAFTFDGHARNPGFIRLVMIENIHMAETLRRSDAVRAHNARAIRLLEELIRRGEAAGAFRPGLDATVLHWEISALCFFNVSNRPTFSAMFGDALFRGDGQALLRDRAVEMVLATVRPGP